MAKTVKFSGIFEKLTPVLLFATIVLAFFVGVLWQKVSSLEKGRGSGVTDPSGNVQAPVVSPLADLPKIAQDLKIDKKKFQSCFDSEGFKARVDSDYQEGTGAGVTGTPASFIVNKGGEVWFIPGAFPYENVKQTIDIALGKASESTLPAQITKLTLDKAQTLPKLKQEDHVLGDRNAKVMMFEYSDFQCPFCQRFHPTVKQLTDEYGKELAYVYRHYPLEQLHPYARPAALASECIAQIGGEDAFWKFMEIAFTTN